MITKKVIKCLILTLTISLLFTSIVFASPSNSVDLKFTISSNKYLSNGVTKKLNANPFISNGTTLVPLRAIMNELGFLTTWYEENQTILCSQDTNAVRLKIGSNKATLNGAAYILDTSPVIVNSTTFVPLKFISESAGASVSWDEKTQSIYISRIGSFDTGSVFFYNSRDYYSYNGNKLSHNALPKDNVINSAYIFKGQILISSKNSIIGSNNLLLSKDGGYTFVRDNFQVLQAIKFENYFLINGLNETNNTYELLAYDGTNFSTIASDFLVKKYILYNGKLIINKYDNNRDYYLYSYDGKSLIQINKGYVVNDFLVLDDNRLYMTGSKSSGNEKYLSRYDLNYFSDVFVAGNKLSYNLPFKLTDLYTTKTGQLYAYYDSSLHDVTLSTVNETTFSLNGRVITLDINNIANLNGSLVLNINNVDSVKTLGSDNQFISDSSYYDTAKSMFKGLMLFDSSYSWSMIYKNATFSKIDVSGNKVIAYGRYINETNNQNNQILLVYDSNSQINYSNYTTETNNPMIINNINSYDNVISLNGDVVLDINEMDISTGKTYNNVIAYKTIYNNSAKTYRVMNLLNDFDVDKFEKTGSVIIISGRDTSGRYGIYKYDGTLSTLKLNSRPLFWQSFGDTMFANFSNSDTNEDEFIVYVNGNASIVSKNMSIRGVTKLNSTYYLVAAENKNVPYSGRNVYIYNSTSNTLSLMKADFSVDKAMFE